MDFQMAVPAVPAGGGAGRHPVAVAQFDPARRRWNIASAHRPAWTPKSASLSLGFVEPTVEIQNLRLYNPPSFGGTPFLNIPEIHVEYDRAALARHEIHVTLMRFNLGELDIVKNEAGQTNIFALGVTLPAKKTGGARRG